MLQSTIAKKSAPECSIAHKSNSNMLQKIVRKPNIMNGAYLFTWYRMGPKMAVIVFPSLLDTLLSMLSFGYRGGAMVAPCVSAVREVPKSLRPIMRLISVIERYGISSAIVQAMTPIVNKTQIMLNGPGTNVLILLL